MRLLQTGGVGQPGIELARKVTCHQIRTLAKTHNQLDITDRTAIAGVVWAFGPGIL